jgi:hypothetical protein
MPSHKRTPMNGYYALRWLILSRDSFTCQYCGQKAPDVKLEVDHVVPVEDGGTDDPDNLKTACWSCNHGKSSLSIMIHRRKNPDKPIARTMYVRVEHRTADAILLQLGLSSPLSAPDIALRMDCDKDLVRVNLHRLLKRGKLARDEQKRWLLAPSTANDL